MSYAFISFCIHMILVIDRCHNVGCSRRTICFNSFNKMASWVLECDLVYSFKTFNFDLCYLHYMFIVKVVLWMKYLICDWSYEIYLSCKTCVFSYFEILILVNLLSKFYWLLGKLIMPSFEAFISMK